MTPQAAKILSKLESNFPFYAKQCLKIRLKEPVEVDGEFKKIIPFSLNRAQLYIHTVVSAQKEKTGRVRALLLKGRQQGCSTYTEGRFFWLTSRKTGVKTFILTHEDKATSNLFRMVKRYYENCPTQMRPSAQRDNAKELYFNKLDSAYGVGTAGTGDVGRSDTIDFFHGSEVAFWKNTDQIRTGVLQAAEKAEEIFLESTANGIGNMFHQMWKDAEAGKGVYIAIFVPWYWQDEYRSTVPDDFEITSEEQAYWDAYKDNGLTDLEQIVWRRNKIVELGDPLLFKQEYPATAAEAFQVTGHNSFISPELVVSARKAKASPYGAYIVGCDPAREGDDMTTFIRRQGRKAWGIDKYQGLDDMAKTGHAKKILDEEPVTMMFIDRGGGSGMYDRLVEMGYGKRVKIINFGGKALDSDRYANRRAEIWGELKKWLESDAETQIPDDDYLHGDLVAPGFKYTSNTQIILEKKRDIKKRTKKSPDAGDAIALTFAGPVQVKKQQPVMHIGYDALDSVVGY